MSPQKLDWQSKAVLLAVLPASAASVVLQAESFWTFSPPLTICFLGVCALFGLAVVRARAATPAAGFAGAAIAACLSFSTVSVPYAPWRTALTPVLAVVLLSYLATRSGRTQKLRLGMAEAARGRNAAQVAANLGMAALASLGAVQSLLMETGWYEPSAAAPDPLVVVVLAALAEAAADTVSSEIGQTLGGEPRLITTLRKVKPGVDGGVTLAGTLAGLAAGAATAAAGAWALRGGWLVFAISLAGGAFGLFFDSLLGATAERRGWLNNDAVNFLSTLSASVAAALLLAVSLHAGLG